MRDGPVALVTGANKGIGLQIAKDLARHGFTVLVGSRDLEHGEAAAAGVGADACAVQLDVTDAGSIAAMAERVRHEFGRLDVLVNNAGISKAPKPGRSFEQILQDNRPSVASIAEVRAVFEVNVFGVLAVTQALLPLLRDAPAGRIVMVSSGAGSMARLADPSRPGRKPGNASYRPSKAALNAIVLALAIELEGTPVKVNAACPGFVATDLNLFNGTGSVEDGAREPVRLALLGPDGPTGTFSSAQGPIPW